MKYLQPFNYKLKNGVHLTVEAATYYCPPLSSDVYTASSRDDLQGELEVVDLLILDEDFNNVTEEYANVIPLSVFIREMELQEEDEEVDLSELTLVEGYEDYL